MKFTPQKTEFLLFSLLLFTLCSCGSTKEYIKAQRTLYEDDVVIEESYQLMQDDKIIESSSKRFYDLDEVWSAVEEDDTKLTMKAFTAVKETSSKSSDEQVTFSLMEYQADKATEEIKTLVLGSKTVKVRNGKAVTPTANSSSDESDSEESSSDKSSQKTTSDSFGAEMEKVFNENLNAFLAYIFDSSENASETSDSAQTESASKDKKIQEVSTSEKVIVESEPNKKYILYTFAGKPFVLAGVTAWNLVKCGGYALINFSGGYNAATGNASGAYWKLPSYKKSKEKAAAAKEANKIQYYPEYHVPLTNNHIVVEKYDRDISVRSLAGGDSEEIVPIERYEYDNTMSVERSASKDAASTAAVAGLVGTAVTIPVSVLSWVGGAAAGIYMQTQK